MDLNNIKRNQLDYILTDILPAELSELFTYKYFYNYLMGKKQDIKEMSDMIVKIKNSSSSGQTPFKGSKNWTTTPLKYTIMKNIQSEREISVLQPMAAIQIFLFISAYQKEMINILEKNSVYSLRHHHNNNDLFYKNRNKAVTKYFSEESKQLKKSILQQTGIFFDIGPYNSIASFTSSDRWFAMNCKYKYCIRSDYKSCFDSIYTHAYKWLMGKDVNDTKSFQNANIYTTIDRILQNINSSTSNGVVVGPEFSRMIAEILLQGIDMKVHNVLLNKGKKCNENYNVYRYVDDIFIFAESEELSDEIYNIYSQISRKYLLQLNDKKSSKHKVPFVLEKWLNETSLFANTVSTRLFLSKKERESIKEAHLAKRENEHRADEKNDFKEYIYKDSILQMTSRSLMQQFNKLVCDYPERSRTIVAYFLGTFLRKVQRNKEQVLIFRETISAKKVFEFLEFAFFAYSYYPDYNNTQRILSIISYVRDEYDIFEEKWRLQNLLNKYSFIFDKANLNDLVNLILFCRQANIEIPYTQECNIVEELKEKDDPILWATYLVYSQYNKKYFMEIKGEIAKTLHERMQSIVCLDKIYTYREIWWLLIFNKSPLIDRQEQDLLNGYIDGLNVCVNTKKGAGDICGNLFIDFLKESDNQFFEWDINQKDILRNITFRTYERSIFKNYKENMNSMDWSSID